jgi:hypothetical protein
MNLIEELYALQEARRCPRADESCGTRATAAGTSICGLGQSALNPLRSVLEGFPDR